MAKKIDWKKVATMAVIVAIIVYVSAAIILVADSYKYRICTKCEVTVADSLELRFVTDREVLKLLRGSDVKIEGITAHFTDLAKVEKMLESKSRIKKAECYFTPSGKARVVITQREPILRVMTGQANYYVDREGALTQVAEKFAAYVPIATGHISKKLAKGDLYKFALYLYENEFWNAFIEQIDVDAHGVVVLVPRVGNQIIRLGTLTGYEKKLSKLLTLYTKGFNKIGWNNYKVINLEYDGQVVCTKK